MSKQFKNLIGGCSWEGEPRDNGYKRMFMMEPNQYHNQRDIIALCFISILLLIGFYFIERLKG